MSSLEYPLFTNRNVLKVQPSHTRKRRGIWAWCVYDWANSAFTTLVVTFVYSTYFSVAFVPNERVGTELWSRGIVISSILIALLSPVFGAVADRGGRRREFLFLCTLVCTGATTALAFISPSQANAVLIALTVFIIANVAFEMGMVFYNAFLPILASPERIGRISGYGWALGYAGGLACMILALFGLVGIADLDPWLSLSRQEGFHIRATNLLVAGWFLLFSLPMFMWVKDEQETRTGFDIRGALEDLAKTFHKVRRYGEVAKFLVARIVFNDGLITIFAFGGIYAAGTFGMGPGEVIVLGIVLNVVAGVGAWAFGFVDDRLGGKTTVLISLGALATGTLLAVIAPTRTWFWVAAIVVGIFVGPNQSASRSLMSRFAPANHQAEFFGFFAFSGKATAFLGPLLLGQFSAVFGQRIGFSTVLFFFVVGAALLMTVDEQRGIESASAGALS